MNYLLSVCMCMNGCVWVCVWMFLTHTHTHVSHSCYFTLLTTPCWLISISWCNNLNLKLIFHLKNCKVPTNVTTMLLYIHVCTKRVIQEHKQTYKDASKCTWWISWLTEAGEGSCRYRTTQYWGLMDQRPADLESCSEYWSPPNSDGRNVLVRLCVWKTQWDVKG